MKNELSIMEKRQEAMDRHLKRMEPKVKGINYYGKLYPFKYHSIKTTNSLRKYFPELKQYSLKTISIKLSHYGNYTTHIHSCKHHKTLCNLITSNYSAIMENNKKEITCPKCMGRIKSIIRLKTMEFVNYGRPKKYK